MTVVMRSGRDAWGVICVREERGSLSEAKSMQAYRVVAVSFVGIRYRHGSLGLLGAWGRTCGIHAGFSMLPAAPWAAPSAAVVAVCYLNSCSAEAF